MAKVDGEFVKVYICAGAVSEMKPDTLHRCFTVGLCKMALWSGSLVATRSGHRYTKQHNMEMLQMR